MQSGYLFYDTLSCVLKQQKKIVTEKGKAENTYLAILYFKRNSTNLGISGIKMTHISSDEDLIPIITLRRKKSKFMGTNKAQKKKEKSIHNKQVMMNKLYFKHSRARNANNHPQKKLALQKRKDIDIKEKIEIKTMLFNIVVYQLVL
ncbi:hypothetical protein PIB30_026097 [Stylosanthes scabra]|uniref:Uncharacterized protein n=1 Tax=Stylosanthes scabra TaxID=79078 RepID=A0ABU6SAE4_9FABA|nr:hypothetical protein [Stylosanthes scabra]